MSAKHPAAVALGRLGGQVKSAAKTAAARQNGARGGRPRLEPRPLEASHLRWTLDRTWSKVHRVSLHAADLTACHRTIPAVILEPARAYMLERGAAIPAEAPRCRQCEAPDHREA